MSHIFYKQFEICKVHPLAILTRTKRINQINVNGQSTGQLTWEITLQGNTYIPIIHQNIGLQLSKDKGLITFHYYK